MRFSKLPDACCFVVLNLSGSSQLMIKTNEGKICDYMERRPVDSSPPPDAEVQQIHIKPKDA